MFVLTNETEQNEMRTFATLDQAMKSKSVVILSIKEFEHKGNVRKSIKVRKAKGKVVFLVVQYESGRYSAAV